MQPVKMNVVAIEGPDLKANLAEAKLLPQSEEDEKLFVKKYILNNDVVFGEHIKVTPDDTSGNDGSNS